MMLQRSSASRSRRLYAVAVIVAAAVSAAPAARAAIIVDDSWADAGRTNGADPLDSNWWTSAASAGI